MNNLLNFFLVLHNCSRYESEIMQLRIRRPVRVCQECYASLKMSSSMELLNFRLTKYEEMFDLKKKMG